MQQVSYTGVVLNPESKALLLSHCQPPAGWDVITDHFTINMGNAKKGPCSERIGEEVKMKAIAFAQDDRVCAVKIESDVPSKNQTKHITIAVNRSKGGKPFHSNELISWAALDTPIELSGTIEECS